MELFTTFAALATLLAGVYSEEPVPFFSSSRYQQNEQVQSGPYQPSGYRPSGAQFRLPERQQQQQQQHPQTVYVPPQVQNRQQPQDGANNEGATTTENYFRTLDNPNRRVNQSRNAQDEDNINNNDNKSGRLVEGSENSFVQEGVYYLYHPNGLLQRVVYSTKNDVQDMGYTAQLRYQNVEPIKEPIYTYDPKTLVLQQIQF